MNRIIIQPYKMASQSSKLLANKLRESGAKVLRVYPDRNYRPRATDVIINWGSTTIPRWRAEILNSPKVLRTSRRKDIMLATLKGKGVPTPEFTTNINVAKTWDGKIVERHNLTGHSGQGIKISTAEKISLAPLYTKLIDKDAEYRVHVFHGEVIDYTKKITRGEKNDVCSHRNGYEFVRNIKELDENKELAIMAVKALDLDFGAVDIIRKDNKSYVLEVNTACGLSDTTLGRYVGKILKYA